MSDGTKIEWCDSSWNPLRARRPASLGADERTGTHCEILTPGCERCYAQAINRRLGTGLPYLRTQRDEIETYVDEKILAQPLRWRRPRRVFVCSMSDLFGEWVLDETIDRVFAVMASAVHHTFLVLTKRPGRMRAYLQRIEDGSAGAVERYMNRESYQAGVRARAAMPEGKRLSEPEAPTRQVRHLYDLAPMPSDIGEYHWQPWPLRHVHLGTSVEDQRRADERIPELLATPAAVRWVSYEPALGAVDFTRLRGSTLDALDGHDFEAIGDIRDAAGDLSKTQHFPGLDWIVIGGESGPGTRPFDIEWARSVIAQCRAAAVPAFVKQIGTRPIIGGGLARPVDRKGGDPSEWPQDLRVREYPT